MQKHFGQKEIISCMANQMSSKLKTKPKGRGGNFQPDTATQHGNKRVWVTCIRARVINESTRLTRLINGLCHTLSGSTRLTHSTRLVVIGDFF